MSIKAMNVSPIDAELLDTVVKLVRLIDNPDEMKFLAPQIIREIIYRLLNSDKGARLSHLLVSEGDTRRISKAVRQLRENIDEPSKIEDMARNLGMSVSGFHHHFKSITALSPLQFQKQIRLQEARRLMLGEDLDVAGAVPALVMQTHLISAEIIKNCSAHLRNEILRDCEPALKFRNT